MSTETKSRFQEQINEVKKLGKNYSIHEMCELLFKQLTALKYDDNDVAEYRKMTYTNTYGYNSVEDMMWIKYLRELLNNNIFIHTDVANMVFGYFRSIINEQQDIDKIMCLSDKQTTEDQYEWKEMTKLMHSIYLNHETIYEIEHENYGRDELTIDALKQIGTIIRFRHLSTMKYFHEEINKKYNKKSQELKQINNKPKTVYTVTFIFMYGGYKNLNHFERENPEYMMTVIENTTDTSDKKAEKREYINGKVVIKREFTMDESKFQNGNYMVSVNGIFRHFHTDRDNICTGETIGRRGVNHFTIDNYYIVKITEEI